MNKLILKLELTISFAQFLVILQNKNKSYGTKIQNLKESSSNGYSQITASTTHSTPQLL